MVRDHLRQAGWDNEQDFHISESDRSLLGPCHRPQLPDAQVLAVLVSDPSGMRAGAATQPLSHPGPGNLPPCRARRPRPRPGSSRGRRPARAGVEGDGWISAQHEHILRRAGRNQRIRSGTMRLPETAPHLRLHPDARRLPQKQDCQKQCRQSAQQRIGRYSGRFPCPLRPSMRSCAQVCASQSPSHAIPPPIQTNAGISTPTRSRGWMKNTRKLSGPAREAISSSSARQAARVQGTRKQPEDHQSCKHQRDKLTAESRRYEIREVESQQA